MQGALWSTFIESADFKSKLRCQQRGSMVPLHFGMPVRACTSPPKHPLSSTLLSPGFGRLWRTIGGTGLHPGPHRLSACPHGDWLQLSEDNAMEAPALGDWFAIRLRHPVRGRSRNDWNGLTHECGTRWQCHSSSSLLQMVPLGTRTKWCFSSCPQVFFHFSSDWDRALQVFIAGSNTSFALGKMLHAWGEASCFCRLTVLFYHAMICTKVCCGSDPYWEPAKSLLQCCHIILSCRNSSVTPRHFEHGLKPDCSGNVTFFHQVNIIWAMPQRPKLMLDVGVGGVIIYQVFTPVYYMKSWGVKQHYIAVSRIRLNKASVRVTMEGGVTWGICGALSVASLAKS